MNVSVAEPVRCPNCTLAYHPISRSAERCPSCSNRMPTVNDEKQKEEGPLKTNAVTVWISLAKDFLDKYPKQTAVHSITIKADKDITIQGVKDRLVKRGVPDVPMELFLDAKCTDRCNPSIDLRSYIKKDDNNRLTLWLGLPPRTCGIYIEAAKGMYYFDKFHLPIETLEFNSQKIADVKRNILSELALPVDILDVITLRKEDKTQTALNNNYSLEGYSIKDGATLILAIPRDVVEKQKGAERLNHQHEMTTRRQSRNGHSSDSRDRTRPIR